MNDPKPGPIPDLGGDIPLEVEGDPPHEPLDAEPDHRQVPGWDPDAGDES